MKRNRNVHKVLFGLLGLVSTGNACDAYIGCQKPAFIPGFVIAPDAGSQTSFSLSSGQHESTTYVVTKDKKNTRLWGFGLVLPKGIVQTGGTCSQPLFHLAAGTSCTAKLKITADNLVKNVEGNYPQVCPGGKAGRHCTLPSLKNQLRVIKTTTPPPIGSTTLDVDSTGIIPVGVGSGTITVTNKGSITAYNVHATLPPSWTGVTQKANGCSSIAPNGTCSITFASMLPYVAQGGIKIVGNNISNAPTIALAFRYQGGLVFSIKGVSPKATVKVVSEVDNTSSIAWDADPNCANLACTNKTGAWDIYHGENLISLPGGTNPNNMGINGPGDTYQVALELNGNNGNINSPATYAAGVCISYNGGAFSDWYLPSICDLGTYDSKIGGTNALCDLNTHSIATNLFSIGFLSSLSSTGYYWSSTEYYLYPTYEAWYQSFTTSGSSTQYRPIKSTKAGVRCIRSIIN